MSIPRPSAPGNSTFDISSHVRYDASPCELLKELLMTDAAWRRYYRQRPRDVIEILRLVIAQSQQKAPHKCATHNWTDADWAEELRLHPEYFIRIVARVRQENLMEPDSYHLRIARQIEPADEERLERLLWFTLEDEAWRRYGVERPRDVLEIRHLIFARTRLYAPHWTDADWAEELRLNAAHFLRILARARERGLMAADTYEVVGVENPRSSPPSPAPPRSPSTSPRAQGDTSPARSTARVQAFRRRQQRVSRNGHETLDETPETPDETPNETHETPFQTVSCNGSDIDIDIDSNRFDSNKRIDIDRFESIDRGDDETHETPHETPDETPETPVTLTTEEPASEVVAALVAACRGKMTQERAQKVVAMYGTARCRDVLDSLPHWKAHNPARIVEDALKQGPAKYPLHSAVIQAREKARQSSAQTGMAFLNPVTGGAGGKPASKGTDRKATAQEYRDAIEGKKPLPSDPPPMAQMRAKMKGSSG